MLRSLVLFAGLWGCASRAPIAALPPAEPLPQAASYQSESAADPLRGDAVDDRLRAHFERAVRAAGLQTDGRLAEISLAIADESDGASRPPSYPLVSFHARRVGIAEPTPQLWLATGGSTDSLTPALEREIAGASRTTHLTHVGAAAQRVPGGVVMAVALSTRTFSLRQPLARSVALGSDVKLDAELAPGYHAPTIAVTDPDGSVKRESLGPDAHFIYTLHAVREGEYTLELLANGPEGLTVIAVAPVMVGRELPKVAPQIDEGPVEQDARDVREHLLALIRDERKKRKLPKLKEDARLNTIATAHSADMVEHGFIAHTSKQSGDAIARVQHAGLKVRLVLENIGRGYSASELHRGLMESPGHRGNILHPDARQIGIGVVAEREGERYAFIATELFTQLE